MKYAKLIASVAAAGLAAVVAVYADDVFTVSEQINVAIAVVTAASVFTAPNVPGAMYTKFFLSALGAILSFLASAISDGVSRAEWFQIGVIIAGAIATWAVPNTTSEVRSAEG
jgi:hypothetical protein